MFYDSKQAVFLQFILTKAHKFNILFHVLLTICAVCVCWGGSFRQRRLPASTQARQAGTSSLIDTPACHPVMQRGTAQEACPEHERSELFGVEGFLLRPSDFGGHSESLKMYKHNMRLPVRGW